MTYFSCDFNDGMPEEFALYDLDGQTPHFSMTQAGLEKDKAWTVVREENTTPSNFYAGSGSKHKYATTTTEKVAADNWMISPAIWIRGKGATLSWDGKSFGETKKTSSYKVLVSTKGNAPEDFTEAAIKTVENESATKWTHYEVSLEQFKGKQIYIAFVNNSLDKEILGIDNLAVEGEKGLCELSVIYDTHITGTEPITVTATLTAFSEENINAFTAYYEHKGETFTKEITGLSLKEGESHTFSFDQKIPVSVGDTIRYKVWAKVNDTEADAVHCTTVPFLFIPQRKVVVEEGTGMWCGFCPKGIVAMEEMHKKYPETFIGIAVHYDDVMEVQGYAAPLAFPAYPSAFVNRIHVSNPPMVEATIDGKHCYTTLHGGLETTFLKALEETTHAEVALNVETTEDKINATVSTRFAVPLKNVNYQIAIAVIENNVTEAYYYQENYFAGTSTPIGGYESMPDRIIAPTFQEVARAIYDNYKGIPGSVPANCEVGETCVFNFSTDIPESVKNIDNAQIIAMLINQENGEILNAEIANATATGIDHVAMSDKAPALTCKMQGETCIVDFNSAATTPATLSLYTASGVRLHSTTLHGGKASHAIDTNGLKGVHFISVAQGNNVSTLKLTF